MHLPAGSRWNAAGLRRSYTPVYVAAVYVLRRYKRASADWCGH